MLCAAACDSFCLFYNCKIVRSLTNAGSSTICWFLCVEIMSQWAAWLQWGQIQMQTKLYRIVDILTFVINLWNWIQCLCIRKLVIFAHQQAKVTQRVCVMANSESNKYLQQYIQKSWRLTSNWLTFHTWKSNILIFRLFDLSIWIMATTICDYDI